MVTVVKPAVVQNKLKTIIHNIVRGYDPERIIIFGSYAQGNWEEGEPVDMIILKETDDDFEERLEKIKPYYSDGLAVNPIVLTEEEIHLNLAADSELINEVIREGVVVYEKNGEA